MTGGISSNPPPRPPDTLIPVTNRVLAGLVKRKVVLDLEVAGALDFLLQSLVEAFQDAFRQGKLRLNRLLGSVSAGRLGHGSIQKLKPASVNAENQEKTS
jgi:hypothetical protein